MLPYDQELERFTALVASELKIEDITRGEAHKDYIVRYRGQLYAEDTAAAYNRLADRLRPLDITPLFRSETGRHAVYLTAGAQPPKPSKVWVNVLLFALTVVSVFIAGLYYTLGSMYDGPPAPDFADLLPYLLDSVGGGLAFTVSLLAILTAHEFGHYLAGRYHGAHVTLPYFLPFPFGAFGTMGAFIQLKSPPKNRRILLDIGIAGPLAGLAVALPVLLVGLALSQVSNIPTHLLPNQGLQIEGNSILYLLSKYIVFGRLLPDPATYGGLAPWLYWLGYFFTGQPLPLGGQDVMLHPVAWAGWAGLLVTALNLIPAGQLDGGHMIYVLLGRRASALLPVILGALVLLGFFWSGWWLWAFLIFLMGRLHAEPLDQITPLDPPRRAAAALAIIIFLLVFTPVPLLAVGI
ncbi:MAG: site-2 protease family protein [Chloroflexi bacterium]|nr:site-2 protease family protein [Chloroflexota bacterium]